MIKMIAFCFFLVLIHLASIHGYSSGMNTYIKHPCKRDCTNNPTPMYCNYTMTVEWFSTMTKLCGNCPYNYSDCFIKDCVPANGLERPIISFNRMLPGPSIEVCEGDIVFVKFINNLSGGESFSVHWHGITQRGTPFMDGVPMVTQCGIHQHDSFQYRFRSEPGTYFYHAHTAMQRGEGAFGSLIVRQKNSNNVHSGLYDFDKHTMMVSDWANNTFLSHFLKLANNNGGLLNANSILINGKGVYYGPNNNNLHNTHQPPRAVFTVSKGFCYRFRVIYNGLFICPIQLSVQNHTLLVIAVDGNDIEPVVADTIQFASGERYDFVLCANQSVANYWIVVKGLAVCAPESVYQTAILNYDGVPKSRKPVGSEVSYDETQTSQSNIMNKWYSQTGTAIQDARSVINKNYSGTPDYKFYLGMRFNAGDPQYLFTPTAPFFPPQINNISMLTPAAPVLYQYNDIPQSQICNESNIDTICPPGTVWCRCIHMIQLKLGSLVELVFYDMGFITLGAPVHPLHLHGYSFAVLSTGVIGDGVINRDSIRQLDASGSLPRNFKNPPLKDTVILPQYGYTIIRFKADNPGAWLLHCHLEMHPPLGQQLIFRVGETSDLPPAPRNWPKCNSFTFSDYKNSAYHLDL